MGSIVKTIGKVIKKVGKALKKIAPILLVAAAAYVGYGYMTGFQSGGWPQITEWGKSLVSGVSQGQTLSQAANAAGGMAETGASTFGLGGEAAISGETEALMSGLDATTSALTPDTATPSTDIMGAATGGEATGGMIGGLPSEGGGLLTQIQDATNTRFTEMMDQSLYPPLSNQVSSWTQAPAKQGGIGDFFLGTTQASPMQAGWPDDLPEYDYFPPGGGGTEINPSLFQARPAQVANAGVANTAVAQATVPSGRSKFAWDYPKHPSGALPHVNEPGAMAKIAAMGKKAWGIYKDMWKSNPWMAAWTTQKVIETIALLVNDQAEKESWRSRHVAGFEPGGPDEVRKRYGGNLPGGNINRAGVGESRRQSSLKAGPKIASRIPTSTIDKKPQGLLGSKQPRQVERALS